MDAPDHHAFDELGDNSSPPQPPSSWNANDARNDAAAEQAQEEEREASAPDQLDAPEVVDFPYPISTHDIPGLEPGQHPTEGRRKQQIRYVREPLFEEDKMAGTRALPLFWRAVYELWRLSWFTCHDETRRRSRTVYPKPIGFCAWYRACAMAIRAQIAERTAQLEPTRPLYGTGGSLSRSQRIGDAFSLSQAVTGVTEFDASPQDLDVAGEEEQDTPMQMAPSTPTTQRATATDSPSASSRLPTRRSRKHNSVLPLTVEEQGSIASAVVKAGFATTRWSVQNNTLAYAMDPEMGARIQIFLHQNVDQQHLRPGLPFCADQMKSVQASLIGFDRAFHLSDLLVQYHVETAERLYCQTLEIASQRFPELSEFPDRAKEKRQSASSGPNSSPSSSPPANMNGIETKPVEYDPYTAYIVSDAMERPKKRRRKISLDSTSAASAVPSARNGGFWSDTRNGRDPQQEEQQQQPRDRQDHKYALVGDEPDHQRRADSATTDTTTTTTTTTSSTY